MHFTPPVQTVYAAIQALKEYYAEGEIAKWERHQRTCNAIHDGLKELGLKEVIRREIQSGLVVSVEYPDIPSWNFEHVHDYCYQRGFTIYPGKSPQQTLSVFALLAKLTNKIFVTFSKSSKKLLGYGE